MYDVRFALKPRYTTSRALLIGIDQYAKANPLFYAVSDADGLRQVLIEDLKFPAENVQTITNADATRTNILRAFHSFHSRSDIDERLVIFFAGHGHTIRGYRGDIGFLVPYDGDSDDPSTLIRWKELTEGADLIRAKHILFIMDACYGGLALTRSLGPGSTRFLKDMFTRFSRQVLTAGKGDETVSDSGGPLPNHSVFTGHLIEGLQGKAASNDSVITANGLMSYVYGKVSKDKNSEQTPHFGHIEGDGDMILVAPELEESKENADQERDTLIVIPYADQDSSPLTTNEKVRKVKELLSSPNSSIELHDFVIDEVRRFLTATGDDNFAVAGNYSHQEIVNEFANRVERYEHISMDISLMTACMAYWGGPKERSLLQKVISRTTERLDTREGLVILNHIRWYPSLILTYCAGLAAVESGRFDSITALLSSPTIRNPYSGKKESLVDSTSEIITELVQGNVFKWLPGHERNHTPFSEHLYKVIQPAMDDVFFLGQSYERIFDEFEMLYALASADLQKQTKGQAWGPVGRFGWKGRYGMNSPISEYVEAAKQAGNGWGPIKAGLFGGDEKRFAAVADEFVNMVRSRRWS